MQLPIPDDRDPIDVQFAILQARIDVQQIVITMILKSQPEIDQLVTPIKQALIAYQDSMLFSPDASETYRLAFEAAAESFTAKLTSSRK